ncbi:FliO/MopB family protein [bacterium]|nr:FliO/MopB family protein [bacterium]
MGGYIVNFTVYTMAMTGLIFFAVFVYKKVMDGTLRSNNTNFLSIEETMSLNPRKTLHVVRAGNEKFLIASDVDRTTLISKLDWNRKAQVNEFDKFRNIEREIQPEFSSYQNPSEPEIKPTQTQSKTVHLEPVKMDNRAGEGQIQRKNKRQKPAQKTVVLDFETPKNHGLSTMREMAKKINEL